MRPVFFIFLAALLLPVPAAAQSRPGDGVQPLDRLLPEIRRTHPGRVYDAEGPTPDAHYRLKWMSPDGRVEWLDTDARTGRVYGAAPDRGGPDRGMDRPRGNFMEGDDSARGRFGGSYGPPQNYDGGGRWRERGGGDERGDDDRRGRGRWNR